MILGIKEVDGNMKFYEEYGYEWGIRRIKYVRESLEQRNIEERVIKELESIEDFWNSNNFYSTSEESEPYLMLEKVLAYFEDTRRTKYADCETRVKELFDKLREYFIEDKDIKLIKEIDERKKEIDDQCYETMTSEKFFENIDCRIKEMELLDRYTDSNHEKGISIYQFVKDTVVRLGISDSYVAQVLYSEMKRSLEEEYKTSKDMPDIVLELEMYRCVIKQSIGTKNEVLEKFNFQFSEKVNLEKKERD